MADARDQAAMLHRRLNSYGGAQPRSLIAAQRRPDATAELEPLSASSSLPLAPALRKRVKPDASTASLHDPTSPTRAKAPIGSPGNRSSKAALAAGTELLNSSAPMPYAKMARLARPLMPDTSNEELVPVEDEPAAAQSGNAYEKRDAFWFIRMLRTELSDHEFAYMNMANTNGAIWDPYDLKIVAFNEVDPNDHYTISEAGVTHCKRYGKEEVAEFTPLAQWEEESGLFNEVMEIPFFKRYQSWKAYTSWRRAIKSDKMSTCVQVRTSRHYRGSAAAQLFVSHMSSAVLSCATHVLC